MINRTENAEALSLEMDWLASVIDTRVNLYFQRPSAHASIDEILPPRVPEQSAYHRLLLSSEPTFQERLILALALAPHIRPAVLDVFFLRNSGIDRGFTEFGGWKGQVHSGFLPTGETAAFLLSGGDADIRMQTSSLLQHDKRLRKQGLIQVIHDSGNEPFLSAQINIGPAVNESILGNYSQVSGFPAHRITTEMEWGDLVLNDDIIGEIEELLSWCKHGATLLHDFGFGKFLRRGYSALFYGPPGTGKTLAACLLGKATDRDVYQVDLSAIISKYIGETEKNLSAVFDAAENKNWILFFDEADALFGKRTKTAGANDRYANQETAYLLQRIEDFPGLVILSTNLRANLNDAFTRRFQNMIHFPLPDAPQRYKIWKQVFGSPFKLDDKINLQEISEKYTLSGGSITNVVRHCLLRAMVREDKTILPGDITRGIARELAKEGKTI